MGHYSTRERYLTTGLRSSAKRWARDGVTLTGEWPDWYDLNKSTRSQQQTYSYRSAPTEAMLSDSQFAAEAEAFSDVTRNGFTEGSPRFDNGHTFFTAKRGVTTSHPRWVYKWYDAEQWEHHERKAPIMFTVPSAPNGSHGSYIVGPPKLDYNYLRLSGSEANVLGAKFISDTLPTKSPVSLAAILGEAYQGLPKLIGMGMLGRGNLSSLPAEAGGEFLNYTFGIAPTISDVKELFQAIADSSKIVQQYHRDSGRVVRRRRGLPPVKTTSVNARIVLPYSSHSQLYGWHGAVAKHGDVNLTEKVSRRTWFSGAYSYYLNDDPDGVIGRFKQFEENANRILGTEITLETLWQLAPWSWLSDWVFNVDDLITNMTYLGKDGLVLRYGYLMNHVKVTQTYSMPDGATFVGGAKTGPITNTSWLESKERFRATPYGFGTVLDGLSVKQWAILGALGLTKAPKSLF